MGSILGGLTTPAPTFLLLLLCNNSKEKVGLVRKTTFPPFTWPTLNRLLLLLCNNSNNNSKEKVGAGAQDYIEARRCRTHRGVGRYIGSVVVKSEP